MSRRPGGPPPSATYNGEKGLLKGERHHVHLSPDLGTATRAGKRRGLPHILTVRAKQMYADGHKFYLSANGVWLTDHVPAQYIDGL